MRLRSSALTVLVLVASASSTSAQVVSGGRNWNVIVGTGAMSSSGGGSGTLMGERLPAMGSIRFRIEDSPWWFGVEMEAWSARATRAGFDSIDARSHTFQTPSPDRNATFRATTVGVLIRRDLWAGSLVDFYTLGGVGATQSEGYIVGKCGVGFNGFTECPEPPIHSRTTGMTLAASGGLGATLRHSGFLKPVPSVIRWIFGERLLAEVRVNSQQATEDRFTSLIAQFGIGW